MRESMLLFLKHEYKLMKYLLLLSFVSILTGCVFPDSRGCHSRSESVQYIKSLSQERLEKLYYDMEKASALYSYGDRAFPLDDFGIEVPEEFSDLLVRRIDLGDGKILVEGCFDDFVYLFFDGLNRLFDSGQKRIIFKYGEDYEGKYHEEVIWSED